MRKIFGFILCCLIPYARLRHAVRNRFYVRAGKTRNHGGKNNKIILVKNGVEKKVRSVVGCEIYFFGDNNTVKIYTPVNRLRLCIKMYGNSEATILSSKFLDRRLNIRGLVNGVVFIDSDLLTNDECLIECSDGTDVHIGKDCIFSDFVELRTSDGHTILNDKNKKINVNKSVYIGNHVWLGKNVMVLKGGKVSDSSIVGARSLVTKPFDETGVIIAGAPAKIIKKGIDWSL